MQSFMSLFAYGVLEIAGYKRKVGNPKRMAKYMDSLAVKNRKRNKKQLPIKAREEQLGNAQIFHINEQENPDTLVVYLHGGGYCEPPLIFHWQWVAQLPKHTGAQVDMFLYPRAPEHQFDETYELLEQYYKDLLKKVSPDKVVFMGDSSGGGLSLGFAEHLVKLGLPQPRELILFSPWMDIRTDYPDLPKKLDRWDPNLQADGLKVFAKAWAGGTDLTDYRLSPILGSFEGVAKTTAFYGTHEIICLDIDAFEKKARAEGLDLHMEIFKNMNHVFPFFPTPEAQIAKYMVYHMLGGK